MEDKENDDFLTSYYESFRFNNKQRIKIEKREELLSKLNVLRGLTTGRLDLLYTNNFISEAVEMLINSIFLYEEGFFDCAFYSVRESYEIMNSMLYLAKGDKKDIQNWIGKKRFPMNGKLKEYLTDSNMSNHYLVSAYEEIKSTISDFFNEQNDLEQKANKIIHKQGLDNFHILRRSIISSKKFIKPDEIKFFEKYLGHTIGIILILFIILEPLSLALTDEEVYMRTCFDSITMPIDLEYYNESLPSEIVDKIKATRFYQDYIQQFLIQERMNDATANLVKHQYFDIEQLAMIREQEYLLTGLQKFELELLEKEIRISRFNNDICFGDWTSIKSNYNRSSWSSNEFDNYKHKAHQYNQYYNGVYISYVTVIGEDLFLEHNDMLTEKEIAIIEEIRDKMILT